MATNPFSHSTAISLTTLPNPAKATLISAPQTHKQNLPTTTKSLSSTLISLSKSVRLEEALRLIESSPPRKPTKSLIQAYASILHACISTKSLHHGRRLYLQLLLTKDDDSDAPLLIFPTLKAKLITLFSVCGRIDEARQVFYDGLDAGELPSSEPVWVAMAIGYLKNLFPYEALRAYCDMLGQSVLPSNFAFSMALKACSDLGDLRLGRAVHAQIVKSNDEPDQALYNALLLLYSQCPHGDEVLQVFDKMPQRNVVSWNSLIARFVSHGTLSEALSAFRLMQGNGIGFSWVTLTTLLPACGRVTALRTGKEIHAQIVKATKDTDVLVLNSLMDMYAKCGEWKLCRRVFDGMKIRDLTSWNTLLTGYGINGKAHRALDLFEEMIASRLSPDGITFVALLSACSHAGLTDAGQRLFDRMGVDFVGVSPNLEHYACLVDILGRAGRINDALNIIQSMPMKPGGSIWGSLLNSCRLHGNVSIGELAAKQVLELEPNNPGNYVMLSNLYATAGMWKSVELVRTMMEVRGIEKEVGCSWIQVKSRVHTFVAGGSFAFRNSPEYRELWTQLERASKAAGYIADTSVVLHDIDDDMKPMWVCGHSERLAAMYGLIHSSSGIPIRITKNLRICGDCHTWMKIVSSVTERLFVLRDTNRFHHFFDGSCSCNDYW